jgi:hypothetical protein
MKGEYVKIWKEAVLADIQGTIPAICLEELSKTIKHLRQDSSSFARDWELRTPEYKAGIGLLTTTLQDTGTGLSVCNSEQPHLTSRPSD